MHAQLDSVIATITRALRAHSNHPDSTRIEEMSAKISNILTRRTTHRLQCTSSCPMMKLSQSRNTVLVACCGDEKYSVSIQTIAPHILVSLFISLKGPIWYSSIARVLANIELSLDVPAVRLVRDADSKAKSCRIARLTCLCCRQHGSLTVALGVPKPP